MRHIESIAQFNALTVPEPTPAERKLIEDCVAGRVCTIGDGTRPIAASSENTIRAELLRFLILGGCDNCRVNTRGVRLRGGWVSGPLDLAFSVAKGRTELVSCHFTDEVSPLQARFEILNMSGSFCPGLNAQGVTVKGDVILADKFHSTGLVNFAGAKIGGELSCKGGRFEHADGVTLNAHGAKVGRDVLLSEGFHSTGRVFLQGAKIGGQLDCNKGRFEFTGKNAKDSALNAQWIVVSGAVLLKEGFHATGRVLLRGAQIGAQLNCRNSTFGNLLKEEAFNARRMSVAGEFFWSGVKLSSGSVILKAAHVGGLTDDLQSWPTGENRLHLDGFTYGRITDASTDAKQRINWLKHGTIWEGEFLPQPYAQLAKVFTEMGHVRAARLVLVEQAKLIRRHSRARATTAVKDDWPYNRVKVMLANKLRWLWDMLQFGVVGYGHLPQRSLVALGILFFVAVFLANRAWDEGSFAPNSAVILTSPGWTDLLDRDCIGPPVESKNICVKNPAETWSARQAPGMDWDSFNRYGYAADLVVPVLSLGQTDAWSPSKDRGDWGKLLWWGRWALEALGWLISALGVAAISGLMQRK